MQDRFKFRLYDKKQSEMIYADNKTQNNINIINYLIYSNNSFIDWDIENYVLMQCTGLKDDNGKLIYENDIVFNNCGQWIIKYCDKCKSFQCFDNTYGCFSCEGDYNWYDFLEDLGRTTVIGNIYDNEELLNGTNP